MAIPYLVTIYVCSFEDWYCTSATATTLQCPLELALTSRVDRERNRVEKTSNTQGFAVYIRRWMITYSLCKSAIKCEMISYLQLILARVGLM